MIEANLQIMRPGTPVGFCVVGVDLDHLSQSQLDQVIAIATEAGYQPVLRLMKLKDSVIPFLEICRVEASADPDSDFPEAQLDLHEKLIDAVGYEFNPNGYSPVHLGRGIKRVEQAA